MAALIRCPEKAPFSVTTIAPDGRPHTVMACRHHLAPVVTRETCAIKNSSGGRPAIVMPVKPTRQCDRWEEPANV